MKATSERGLGNLGHIRFFAGHNILIVHNLQQGQSHMKEGLTRNNLGFTGNLRGNTTSFIFSKTTQNVALEAFRGSEVSIKQSNGID